MAFNLFRWLSKFGIHLVWLLLLNSCSDDPQPVTHLVPNPNQPPGFMPKDIIAPKLVSQLYAYDSIKLSFNEPVKVLRIVGGGLDIDSSRVVLADSLKTVKFRITLFYLGAETIYRCRVQDKAGNEGVHDFTIRYYDKQVEFSGQVQQFLLSKTEDSCYVLTRSIDQIKLNILSMESKIVIGQFSLNFLVNPGHLLRMAYNPKNDLFYFYSDTQPYLYAFSLTENRLIKTIEISDTVNIDNPIKFPVDLAFTNSGKGLLKVSRGSSSNRLKVIDSSNNDSITSLPAFDAMKYYSLTADDSGSKIYFGTSLSAQSSFINLFSETGEISAIQIFTRPFGYAPFIVPNKKNNSVLIRSNSEFIKDLDTGIETSVSYTDTYGDFSYAAGEENFAYFYKERKFMALLNYNDATTVLQYPVSTSFELTSFVDLTTTVNNKHLLMRYLNYLYFFNVADLRRQNLNQP